MKKTTKILSALAALTFATAAFAGDESGNIRGIHAMPDYAHSISFPNSTAPLQVGQQVYILVRLLNEDWMQTKSGGDVHPWYFRPSAA